MGRIENNDVLFATHWTTVDAAIENKDMVLEVIYFVQDFEPYFTPMSSEYIMAENTYRQGIYSITAGPWCEQFLKNEFQAEADHFEFPIDRNIYYPRERKNTRCTILFFAKPEMPRRCYELGVATLHKFYNKWHKDVEIVFFGSKKVDRGTIPFPFKHASLIYNLNDLAQLYTNADLGIVFSPTNPSFVPYEMMACGLPVVDLDRAASHYNYGQRRDIAFLADPRPTIMAEQIIELLNNKEELELRRKNSMEFVSTFKNEEQIGRRIEELIKRRIS
jgi:glycosyltransferase involved in cell wall biosynthesis